MGWIEVSEDLQIYTLTDEFLELLEWGLEFMTKMTPAYYGLLFLSMFLLILIMLAFRFDIIRMLGVDKK